jgi:steroid 5-alpha reductase family enzyme
MSESSNAPIPRPRALALIVASYVMAIAAGLATLAWAPIEDPIWRTFAADAVATIVIFGWSMTYDNSSFYDAYWSVIPPLIVLYWMLLPESVAVDARAWMIFGVLLVWGARLTWNWARGWTGMDHEDWRYADFRVMFPRTYWLVSFGGVHFFPTTIVFVGLVAAWPALVTSDAALSWIDGLALVVGVGGIAFEWIADAQLHAFSKIRKPGETLRTGLWRYSRHPNYLGEMMIWWSLWLFGLAADTAWATYAIAAPIAMTAMFLGFSIPALEKRSLERRANYQDVIDTTSMLIPLPPKRPKTSGA